MENTNNTTKAIGILLITGAIALLIPYTILAIIFDYPVILREETSTILSRFHEGGSSLIWTWFAFAITGIPLIPAYILMGREMENKSPLVRIATNLGTIGLIVQMIGLLSWTFVVPVLAVEFVQATDEAVRASAITSFKTIHQFGGVLLGEHMGQLFTIFWTVLMTIVFAKIKLFPRWIIALGLITSFIYLLAQLELFKTVIPDLPIWDKAGFIGSTLWLIWLVIIGIGFLKLNANKKSISQK